jgi:hypothetical protein
MLTRWSAVRGAATGLSAGLRAICHAKGPVEREPTRRGWDAMPSGRAESGSGLPVRRTRPDLVWLERRCDADREVPVEAPPPDLGVRVLQAHQGLLPGGQLIPRLRGGQHATRRGGAKCHALDVNPALGAQLPEPRFPGDARGAAFRDRYGRRSAGLGPVARPPSTTTASAMSRSNESVCGNPNWSARRPITGGPTMKPV